MRVVIYSTSPTPTSRLFARQYKSFFQSPRRICGIPFLTKCLIQWICCSIELGFWEYWRHRSYLFITIVIIVIISYATTTTSQYELYVTTCECLILLQRRIPVTWRTLPETPRNSQTEAAYLTVLLAPSLTCPAVGVWQPKHVSTSTPRNTAPRTSTVRTLNACTRQKQPCAVGQIQR